MQKIIITLVVIILTMSAAVAAQAVQAGEFTAAGVGATHTMLCDTVNLVKTPLWKRLITAGIAGDTEEQRDTTVVQISGGVSMADLRAAPDAAEIVAQNSPNIVLSRLFCMEEGSDIVLSAEYANNGFQAVYSARLLTSNSAITAEATAVYQ